MSNKKNIKSKKKGRICPDIIIHIQASFNNTIVSITDPKGDLLLWSSSGKMGFKNARKSTPYASQCAMSNVLQRAISEHGAKRANVIVKGPGFGRESALRSLIGSGCEVLAVIDNTPVPHNGCRAPKKRRL